MGDCCFEVDIGGDVVVERFGWGCFYYEELDGLKGWGCFYTEDFDCFDDGWVGFDEDWPTLGVVYGLKTF